MNNKRNKYLLVYSFARLIRIENLFLMALVLYVSNHYIYKKEAVGLSPLNLTILIISTISIAAGGYVINDYFDLKIDKVNRPDNVILEKIIHRKAGIIWHLLFSIIGLLASMYLAHQATYWLMFIQMSTIVLLLIYSIVLKRIFILGNYTIAFLSGLLPMLPYIYIIYLSPTRISFVTTVFLISLSAFAFFTTLIRELIKDIQDMEGDSIGNRKTIPLVWGLTASKIIIFFLILLLIIFLIPFLVYYYLSHHHYALWYNIFFLIFPSILLIFLLISYQEPKKFYVLSLLMKFIMLSGIVFYFIF